MPVAADALPLSSRAGYFATNLMLRGLIGLTRALPYDQRVRTMGWLVSRVVAPVAGFDRRIRANLELTHPDMAPGEIARLCRAVPDNVGRTLMEIYSGAAFTRRARDAPITGPGLVALEQARAEGRPVVLVTGHFGNYDAARACLVGRGFEMGALYRRMANPYFNEHYVRAISAIGRPMFEQGRRGMMEMVKHLKGGGIIAILADLHAHGGEETTFFGKPAVTSLITAELALKYGAPLIPVYGLRQPDGLSFEIVMQAPIPPGTALEMMQAVNSGLEDLVRSHMDQWFWIHRRWKPWLDRGLAEGALDTET